jgi:hypothetical protein
VSRAELRERRERLAARAAAERDVIGRQLDGWQRSLSGVDKAMAVFHTVKQHVPLLGVGLGMGVSALLVARPGLSRVVQGGAAVWRLGRSVRRLVSGLRD